MERTLAPYFEALYSDTLFAVFASQASAMFIQADWLDPTQPGVGTNRYSYSFNDPINLLDPSGNVTIVTDSDDNDLFSLDDGREDTTRTTAKDAYDQGIQWFEEDADNYMELLSVDPRFSTHSGVKHFTWGDIGRFSDQNGSSFSYRTGGAGDWKASPQGADGYRLSDVEGAPYWSDGLGQVPFAADTCRGYRQRGYSHQQAAELTARRGAQFSEGSVVKGIGSMLGIRDPDVSNSYDNAIFNRTTNWAQDRWSFPTYGAGSRYRQTHFGNPYSNLGYWGN